MISTFLDISMPHTGVDRHFYVSVPSPQYKTCTSQTITCLYQPIVYKFHSSILLITRSSNILIDSYACIRLYQSINFVSAD